MDPVPLISFFIRAHMSLASIGMAASIVVFCVGLATGLHIAGHLGVGIMAASILMVAVLHLAFLLLHRSEHERFIRELRDEQSGWARDRAHPNAALGPAQDSESL